MTLERALYSHNNDYGFDPTEIITTYSPDSLPSISVTIPYFETGEIINKTLHHLYKSLNTARILDPKFNFEVNIIDDGSKKRPAETFINVEGYENLNIISFKTNRGRTAARNQGLEESKHEICLFMDSDIFIDTSLISNHLKLHRFNSLRSERKAISVSFFRFTDRKDPRFSLATITPNDLSINDYRLFAEYGPKWIGCEEDKAFVGQKFNILHDTNYFRDWNGKYYAWALTNMVLGGFFMVNRYESIQLGKFNPSFNSYGFTETSLPTKLIAMKHNYLIPITIGGGLHIEDRKVNVPYEEKIQIFQRKHDYYFNKYLKLNFKKAVEDAQD